jgi:carnitine 3-dehydrogenase
MSHYFPVGSVKVIAVVGTGTIGSSWATYFLSKGFKVKAWDPSRDWKERITDFINNAWPQVQALGAVKPNQQNNISLCSNLSEALSGVDFVQENSPEQLELKQALFGEMDGFLPENVIISSSTSGLIMSDMQEGLSSAHRFVVGHPFNPPHLIPLVEVVGGKNTDPFAVDWAIDFYNQIGKRAIKIKKEVAGHLANRLQAALWREAVLAVKNDLASVEDINAAVAMGPGLRWALMGPHMIMNLTGSDGGYQKMLENFGPGIEDWWETMNENPSLTPDLKKALINGINLEAGNRSISQLEAERDERLVKLLTMLKDTKNSNH